MQVGGDGEARVAQGGGDGFLEAAGRGFDAVGDVLWGGGEGGDEGF